MAEWKKLTDDLYEFRGKTVLVSLQRMSPDPIWRVTCDEARLNNVPLIDFDVEQARNEAIGMVADRLGWLARGWVKELKQHSMVLADLAKEPSAS